MNELDDEDEKFANNEYTKFVVKALKEAIDENERVMLFRNTIFSKKSNFSKIFNFSNI